MSGVINIATSSLAAYQRALDVIGNNIANANTPGYSRQTVDFAPKPAQRFGDSFVGAGVDVLSIKRHTSEFVNAQVRTSLSSFSEFDMLYTQSIEIDRLLSQDGTSISTGIQGFMDALSQVNESPASSATRGVLFSQAELMVDQFQSMQQSIGKIDQNTTVQLTHSVQQMNDITAAIAEINNQIANGLGGAPDLLDQRERLLLELSSYTETRSSIQADGTMNVSIGKGEVVVLGGNSLNLSVGANASSPSGLDVYVTSDSGRIAITDNIQGGSLGGLFNFKSEMLDKVSQTLGQMAIGLSMAMNQQHQLGMDLNGQAGKPMFTDYNDSSLQLSRVSPHQKNVGTAAVSLAITNPNQLQASDYEFLIVDRASNQVQITRLSDGVSNAYTLTNTPPSGSVDLDGMRISVDDLANLNDNDIYTLSPTKGAANLMSFTLNNPREFAMASPVRVQSALTNQGTTEINIDQILNSGSDVAKEYRIDFASPTQYNLVNVTDATSTGPFTFTPNSNNTVSIPNAASPAYTLTLSGLPKAGDQFSAEYNSGGIGDNSNGLKLFDYQTTKGFMGGTESIFDRYSSIIADVGGRTFQAQMRQESGNILHQQAIAQRDSISGVNLDEEAANLLRFQQAYQAAGQVLAVTKQLMDVLFSTFR